MAMKYVRNAGETQINYQSRLNTILIRYDYNDYFIITTSRSTNECGFKVVNRNSEILGTYYYNEKGMPNVGDMYSLGYKAIDSVLPYEVLSKLNINLSSEILAFLFGQSAALVRLYKITKEQEDG